jgi:hypothetical protein
MEELYKSLGKICVTLEGEHDVNKKYSKLSIVYKNVISNFGNGVASYISKKDIPANKNINIDNEEYWQILCSPLTPVVTPI